MKGVTEAFLSHLGHNRGGRRGAWGKPEVRERYEATIVADSFEEMLRELLS
jgi:hypothetical protein